MANPEHVHALETRCPDAENGLPSLPARIEFTGLDLSGADVACTDISGVNLQGSDLSYVNFHGCDLTGANLSSTVEARTNLVGTDLSNSTLHGADLRGSYLVGANLFEADLTEALVEDAKFFSKQLHGAKLDVASFTPDNFVDIGKDGRFTAPDSNGRHRRYSVSEWLEIVIATIAPAPRELSHAA